MTNTFSTNYFDKDSTFKVELISNTLTANRLLKLPNVDDTLATLADIGAAGGGSVTSVALALPNIFTVAGSPITTSGTINATLASQTANTFLGVGNTNGIPTFKTLTTTDIPSLPFTKITGVANITQIPNIPTSKLTGILDNSQMASGTNNSFLQLDSESSGGRITWDTATSEFRLRNSDGSAYADLRVKDFYVEGTTTTINSETLNVADNKITLNSGFTGAPTEDAGIEIERGTSANAFIQWNETTDLFEAGVTGSLLRLIRESTGTIVAGNISGNTVTVTHNLGNQHPELTVKRTDGVIISFAYTATNANSLTFDQSRSGSTVGWTWYVKG
ncbi:MAG: hypothetical protein HC907_17825 [Richelia sp. SM1_7_0]|nr:hypothetical protein [Richelia sp. SM1_7_0]